MNNKDSKVNCCPEFRHALQSGTDNEGYGALINYYGGEYHIGSCGVFKYCPFCGKEILELKARESEGV